MEWLLAFLFLSVLSYMYIFKSRNAVFVNKSYLNIGIEVINFIEKFFKAFNISILGGENVVDVAEPVVR